MLCTIDPFEIWRRHAEWQTFEKPENKRQMYVSQAWVYYIFVSYFQVFQMSAISPVFGPEL